jgi:hypothetical protein
VLSNWQQLPAIFQPTEWKRIVSFVGNTPGKSARGSALNPSALRLFELARVLVRLDHVARFIVNANHSVM